MPTYTYRCTKCKHEWNISHGINIDIHVRCPECGKRARKIITSVPGYVKGTDNPTKT